MISQTFRRNLAKLEKLNRIKSIPVPPDIQKWINDLTLDELRACIAFSSIPENDRPADMFDPYEYLAARLPIEAITWAKKLTENARLLWEIERANVPDWVLNVLWISQYELKSLNKKEIINDQPLLWSDFTDEIPYARQFGDQHFLKRKENYRKKPSAE